MNYFSIRAGLVLAFFWTAITACHAAVVQAHINPVPLRLPVDHASDIRFAHISTAQGLSQIRVSSIVQDSQGFMWFGTLYGLNRFDGYTFKVYMHERGNPNSLSGVDVEALFKDRDGAIWVGCEQALDRFDPKTETFTHFSVQRVKQISQDSNGLLWLSTDSGLYRLDPASGKTRLYAHDPSDPDTLPDNHVVAAAEDITGRFWVGEPTGMYEFDRTTGHIKLSIPLRTGARDFSFHEDKKGKFWIIYGTGNGLAQFDRKRNILTYYSFSNGDIASTGYSGVDAMLEDRHGNLWIAKQGFGLLRLDREHNRFISYINVPGDSGSLTENNIISLFEDRDGSIWVGLPDEGLQRFSPVQEAFQSLSSALTGAHSFYEDSHGSMWIGTAAALVRVDPSGKRTTFGGPEAGASLDILSIVQDPAGLMWVGTSNSGLFRLDLQSGKWKIYRHKEGDASSLSNNVVFRLLIGHDGTLWAATWDGIDRFDARSDSFTTFKANFRAREQIYLSLAEDSRHDLWLGTLGLGMQQLNPRTAQFVIYTGGDSLGSVSNSEVNWVHIAPSTGKVWAATSNGLNEFDPESKQFTVYGLDEGIASSFIDCIQEDTRGKLWMSTSKGISSFDPSTKRFRNFSTADGLPGPEMIGPAGCLKTANGRMYFAGLSGTTTFLPEAILDNSSAPPTVITDFRLLGFSPSPRQRIIPQAISYASEITLSHKQTPFSLTFAALSYSNSPANRYRYKLENVETAWTEVGSESRTVTYTALPAGKYRFRVQGATNSSPWSEPGAELQIIILPPWWNTWWFRTIYTSAALLAIWSVYALRLKQATAVIRARLGERLQERERIARELHDTLLQDFQAVILRFQLAAKRMGKGDPNRTTLEEGLDYADRVLAEGRNYIRDIRADTKADDQLSKSLAEYGKELSQERPLAFSLNVIGSEFKLDPIVRDEIHGIGREAIGNAFKHSNGSAVQVEIAYKQNELELRIRDDGDGIHPNLLSAGRPGHWGIHSMKERAEKIGASLTISSQPNAGTSLELKLPVRSAHGIRTSLRHS